MASDHLVSARAVLRVMTLRRVGTARAMTELEQVEPDLASYLMEEFSLVHRDLLALRGPPRRTLRLQERVQTMALTCVEALREAHYELWQRDAAGTPWRGWTPMTRPAAAATRMTTRPRTAEPGPGSGRRRRGQRARDSSGRPQRFSR